MVEFKLKKEDIKRLIDMKGSCIVSNKITVEGEKIGYMYREKPSNEVDTGWRFFSGNEDDDYTNNPDNFNVFDINTICNYDDTIIPYLNSEINISYEKVDDLFRKIE